MKKLSASFFGAVLGLLLLPAASQALTVSPSSYDYASADRGAAIVDKVTLMNEGETPVTVYPSIRNFTFVEGDEISGTPRFYEVAADPYGTALGRWVKVGTSPITVNPGEQVDVPFTINVPGDATPGGHFGALLFAVQTPDQVGTIAIGTQVGALIAMRVNGDIKEAAAITEFGFKEPRTWYNFLPVDFFVRLENNGNVHLRPNGSLVVTDMMGRRVAEVPVNEESRAVLPNSIRRYELSWSKADGRGHGALWNEWNNFAVGKYKARLTLGYGTSGQAVSAETSFFVWPWRLMLIFIASLATLFFFFKFGRETWKRSVIRKHERLAEKRDLKK